MDDTGSRVDNHWSLTERPGFLRIKALPASNLLDARNTLTQMLADPALEAVVVLDVKGMADGQNAGLCMLDTHPAWVGIVQEQGKRHLVFYNSINKKLKGEIMGPQMTQDLIYLKVKITADLKAAFSYSLDNKAFASMGDPVKLDFSWWKGARIGLFTYNTNPSVTDAGVADFANFKYQPADASK